MDLKTLKQNRKKEDDTCSVEVLSTRNPHEFLSTCMEMDFNRAISTVDLILDVMGVDNNIADKLVEEMDNLSDTLNQCYESSVVNEMLDRGYIYINGVFSNGIVEIPFDNIVYHDIDEVINQAIAMSEQLKEIKGLKERKDK